MSLCRVLLQQPLRLCRGPISRSSVLINMVLLLWACSSAKAVRGRGRGRGRGGRGRRASAGAEADGGGNGDGIPEAEIPVELPEITTLHDTDQAKEQAEVAEEDGPPECASASKRPSAQTTKRNPKRHQSRKASYAHPFAQPRGRPNAISKHL